MVFVLNYKKWSGPLTGLKIWKIKPQLNNTTWHITVAKIEKPCVTKLGHPMIQLLLDPLLAVITWNNNFLYDFICLSHRSGGLLVHSSLQHCSSLLRFVGTCLCMALTTAFQSGWGLDFDNALATRRFFSFQLFCCSFADMLGIIVLLHNTILAQL